MKKLLIFTLLILSTTSKVESRTFHGYPCTEDCSGHEAGYEWAENNSITDPNDCSGNSQSFIEGCESYAEEYSDESDDENETIE